MWKSIKNNMYDIKILKGIKSLKWNYNGYNNSDHSNHSNNSEYYFNNNLSTVRNCNIMSSPIFLFGYVQIKIIQMHGDGQHLAFDFATFVFFSPLPEELSPFSSSTISNG